MCFSSPVKSADGTKAAAICFQQYGLSQAIALLPVAYQAKRITGRQFLANPAGSIWAIFWGVSAMAECLPSPSRSVRRRKQRLVPCSLSPRKQKQSLTHHMVLVACWSAWSKAVLCNWMVCLGVIAAMTSTSALGKIIASGMPILIFFALGFEHSVVNMFGMILGAKVSFADWWLWNQIPVTVGNLLGGWLLIGLPLYLTYGKQSPTRERLPATKSSEVPHEAQKAA
jgi:Formate/nitrite transporter